MALNIKRLATLQPALIMVLLITFSFVGATQGSVYCSPLHYCHVANVVAMVWPLRHVLWISIIFQSDLCWRHYPAAQISFSFILKSQTPPLKVTSVNHFSAIDVIWWPGKQSADGKSCSFSHTRMFYVALAQWWDRSLLHAASPTFEKAQVKVPSWMHPC